MNFLSKVQIDRKIIKGYTNNNYRRKWPKLELLLENMNNSLGDIPCDDFMFFILSYKK